MRSNNKLNAQQTMKKTDINVFPKRPRNDDSIVNPEKSQNRLKNNIKGLSGMSRINYQPLTQKK
jgi:hypothetical protein